MPHVNADTLALLALGEDIATAEERGHIDGCAQCRRRVEEMAATAAVGRTVLGLERLVAPPPRVWSAIAAELDLPQARSREAVGASTQKRRVQKVRTRRHRAFTFAAVAALLIAGIATTVTAGNHTAGPRTLASADLQHLPGWSGRSGRGLLQQYPDGRRVVVVTTNLAPSPSDAHEVWLMDAATGARLGLGVLRGTSGTFTLPRHTDLADYSYIDISAEPNDGNPAPSGDSIIRGQLRS